MQIGVFAKVRQRLAVGIAVELEVVGLLCRGEESVGREEPRVPQGALARERRDVSRERRRRLLLRVAGEEDGDTLMTANNYANLLEELNRYEEAKELVRNTMPVARRVLGESHEITLRMRSIYATALRRDPNATLDDLREAVTTYEETERTSRRVLGGAHPTTTGIEKCLGEARAVLRARETLPMSA